MKRLTFEGNFCDIAQCSEVRYGSFCEDGYCSQRRVWEKLKRYEDLEEQGRMVELPEIEIEDCTRCWYCAPHGGCSIHNTVPGGCKDFASKAKRGTALAASGKEVRYE